LPLRESCLRTFRTAEPSGSAATELHSSAILLALIGQFAYLTI
jgi:hypothetical protein